MANKVRTLKSGMEHATLPGTSLEVSRVALGTASGTGTTPGTYHARLYFDSAPGVIQALSLIHI